MLLFPCIDKSWVLYLVYFFTIICYNMYKSHSKYAKINSHIEVTTQIIYEHHGECPSDINKQSLKVPGEWLLDKNIHSVLSNVLFNNVLFKSSPPNQINPNLAGVILGLFIISQIRSNF